MKPIMKPVILLQIIVFGALAGVAASSPAPDEQDGEYLLTEFGGIESGEQAQAVLDRACKWIIENGGGMLTIPANFDVPLEVKSNLHQTQRDGGPTVTIRDLRKGYEMRHLPTVGQQVPGNWVGEYRGRVFDTGPENGLAPFGSMSMLQMRNAVVRGASSYGQFISNDVKAGKDRRIDLPSIRGIFVGQQINLSGKPRTWNAPNGETVRIKDIGWDTEKACHYAVVDELKFDHAAGSILGSKHVINSLTIENTANTDTQNAGDLNVETRQYAQGDAFVIHSTYEYQGDVFSGVGDERGAAYAATVTNDLDPFHGKVQSVDWSDDAIHLEPGKINIQKLATSRPLINMNRDKWITSGKVRIVPPDNWGGDILRHGPAERAKELYDNGIPVASFPFESTVDGEQVANVVTFDDQPVRHFRYTWRGKAYPSLIFDGINHMGGRIIGDPECGWTPEVVGRFFAVADPGEYISPKEKTSGKTRGARLGAKRPVYRWYLIKQFEELEDGSFAIRIERIRWDATDSGAPTLYREDNYTWEGHDRPLDYIIAPGAFAYDIGDAWKDRKSGVLEPGEPNAVRVVPHADRGTAFDFEEGDLIEQAVGPDPAGPRAFYAILSQNIPTTLESKGASLISNGKVTAGTAVSIESMTGNRDQLERRKDGNPPWMTGVKIGSLTQDGIVFNADVTRSALRFEQPNGRTQPISWRTRDGEATLTVDPADARMKIDGASLSVQNIEGVQGISNTETPAHNLRGKDVGVSVGNQQIEVKFSQPEPDADYAVWVQPSWFTMDKIEQQTKDGFVVRFSEGAPQDATIDWLIVR